MVPGNQELARRVDRLRRERIPTCCLRRRERGRSGGGPGHGTGQGRVQSFPEVLQVVLNAGNAAGVGDSAVDLVGGHGGRVGAASRPVRQASLPLQRP
jgi:hypothetical protein